MSQNQLITKHLKKGMQYISSPWLDLWSKKTLINIYIAFLYTRGTPKIQKASDHCVYAQSAFSRETMVCSLINQILEKYLQVLGHVNITN